LIGTKELLTCKTPHLEIMAGEQFCKFSHSIKILIYCETGIDSPDNKVIFDASSKIALRHSNHL
jgi:hypothetical protein